MNQQLTDCPIKFLLKLYTSGAHDWRDANEHKLWNSAKLAELGTRRNVFCIFYSNVAFNENPIRRIMENRSRCISITVPGPRIRDVRSNQRRRNLSMIDGPFRSYQIFNEITTSDMEEKIKLR